MNVFEQGICPHCNQLIDILDDLSEVPEHEEYIDCVCPKCNKNFTAVAKVSVSFICN